MGRSARRGRELPRTHRPAYPEGILRHASHLHAAAGGVIGDLTGMVHMLAMEAIDNGTERLDLDTVFGTVPVGAPDQVPAAT